MPLRRPLSRTLRHSHAATSTPTVPASCPAPITRTLPASPDSPRPTPHPQAQAEARAHGDSHRRQLLRPHARRRQRRLHRAVDGGGVCVAGEAGHHAAWGKRERKYNVGSGCTWTSAGGRARQGWAPRRLGRGQGEMGCAFCVTANVRCPPAATYVGAGQGTGPRRDVQLQSAPKPPPCTLLPWCGVPWPTPPCP